MMGMLNARGHFFIPAMGAPMMNMVMIVSVFGWRRTWAGSAAGPRLPVQIFALAYGVLAAGVAQAAFQIAHASGARDFGYRWVSPWSDETVRRCDSNDSRHDWRGGVSNQCADRAVDGILCGNGLFPRFNGAVRLMELPQGMFGISLATYLLPTLSDWRQKKICRVPRPRCGTGLSRYFSEFDGLGFAGGAGRADCSTAV